MRSISALFIAMVMLASLSWVNAEQDVSISIDTITQNDQITGKVVGLTEEGRKAHKVVVYVKTNQWYVHPYEDGGNGKAWASIGSDGSWSIETVKREFPARSIAALVVPEKERPPTPTGSVRAIKNKAIVVKKLEETPDHGKL